MGCGMNMGAVLNGSGHVHPMTSSKGNSIDAGKDNGHRRAKNSQDRSAIESGDSPDRNDVDAGIERTTLDFLDDEPTELVSMGVPLERLKKLWPGLYELNHQDGEGDSVLHVAIRHTRKDIICLCLDLDIDVCLVNHLNQKPTDLCVKYLSARDLSLITRLRQKYYEQSGIQERMSDEATVHS